MSISQFPAPATGSSAVTYKLTPGQNLNAELTPGLYSVDGVDAVAFPISLKGPAFEYPVQIALDSSTISVGSLSDEFETPKGIAGITTQGGAGNQVYYMSTGTRNNSRWFKAESGSFGNSNANQYSDDEGTTWLTINRSTNWNAGFKGLIRNFPGEGRPQEGTGEFQLCLYGGGNNNYNRAISNDNGANWSIRNGTPSNNSAIFDHAVGDNRVVFAQSDGVTYSNSNSASNLSIATGTTTSTRAVAYDGTKYYGIQNTGTVIVSNTGTAWNTVATLVTGTNWRESHMAASPNEVLAMNNAYQIFKSTDSGVTWTQPATIDSSIYGGTNKIQYFGLEDVGAYLLPTSTGNVWYSTDKGETFEHQLLGSDQRQMFQFTANKPGLKDAGTPLVFGRENLINFAEAIAYLPSYVTLTPLSKLEDLSQ